MATSVFLILDLIIFNEFFTGEKDYLGMFLGLLAIATFFKVLGTLKAKLIYNKLTREIPNHMVNYIVSVIKSKKIANIIILISYLISGLILTIIVAIHAWKEILKVSDELTLNLFIFALLMLMFLLIINTMYYALVIIPSNIEKSLGTKNSEYIILSIYLLALLLLFNYAFEFNIIHFQISFYTSFVLYIVVLYSNIKFLFSDFKNIKINFNLLSYSFSTIIYLIGYGSFVTFNMYKWYDKTLELKDSQIETIDYFYFTITSLTTLGYGDITPAIPIAKIWSGVLAFSGLIFLALIIGILSNFIMSDNKQVKE